MAAIVPQQQQSTTNYATIHEGPQQSTSNNTTIKLIHWQPTVFVGIGTHNVIPIILVQKSMCVQANPREHIVYCNYVTSLLENSLSY